MPKGRMLSKKISQDEKIAQLPMSGQLLFTWLIPHLDVRGRIYGTSVFIKGSVVPFIKELRPKNISTLLQKMHDLELIVLYGEGQHKYIEFVGFTKNQTLNEDREAESVIPSPTPDQLRCNSGATPGKVNLSKVNINKGKANEETPFSFEEIWSKYPNKDGRKAAEKHFKASVKTEQDNKDIQMALSNYLKCENVAKNFIKNGSTWFNNWRDWVVPPKGQKAIIKQETPKYKTDPKQQEEVSKLISATVQNMKG